MVICRRATRNADPRIRSRAGKLCDDLWIGHPDFCSWLGWNSYEKFIWRGLQIPHSPHPYQMVLSSGALKFTSRPKTSGHDYYYYHKTSITCAISHPLVLLHSHPPTQVWLAVDLRSPLDNTFELWGSVSLATMGIIVSHTSNFMLHWSFVRSMWLSGW